MYGWPLLVHYCDTCHYNTPISCSSTVWIELHTCAHCGTESVGADIAGRSAAEMNQSQHEELAALFARSMTVTQQPPPPPPPHQQPSAIVEDVTEMKEEREPVHFISSHYTGTAHIRSDPTSEQPPPHSPPPSYHEAMKAAPEVLAAAAVEGLVAREAAAETLRQHGVDPQSLLPNQTHLFINADSDQKMRLLELWRIAPPNYRSLEDRDWMTTSVEREEELARVRWEAQQQTSRQVYHEEHMLDTHLPQHSSGTQSPDEPISPIREHGEPAWPPAARMRAASILAGHSKPETRYGEPEPYIVTGYGEEASVKAVDPVYAAAAGLWQAPSYAQATMSFQDAVTMADQYGMYEQIRNHADWQRMNERLAREKMGMNFGNGGDDGDMEL